MLFIVLAAEHRCAPVEAMQVVRHEQYASLRAFVLLLGYILNLGPCLPMARIVELKSGLTCKCMLIDVNACIIKYPACV